MTPLEQYLSPFEQYPDILSDLLSAELPYEWTSDTTTFPKCTHERITATRESHQSEAFKPFISEESAGFAAAAAADDSSVGGSPVSVGHYYSPGPEPAAIPLPDLYKFGGEGIFAGPGRSLTGAALPLDSCLTEDKVVPVPAIAAENGTAFSVTHGPLSGYAAPDVAMPSPVVSLSSTPVIAARTNTDKARERRARNTEAARRSRGRVKTRITELEALVEQLTAANRRLTEENEWLKRDRTE